MFLAERCAAPRLSCIECMRSPHSTMIPHTTSITLRGLLVACLTSGSVSAVVVFSGGPNNTASVDQPYFANVGSLNGASAIYLGNRWVMTAQHVAGTSLPSSVNFGGTNYTTLSGSYHQLTNNAQSGLSSLTDIVLFRLSSDPLLPTLSLASSAPTVGTAVMMIGNGRIQNASPTYWNVTVNPGSNNDVWTVVTSTDSYNRVGFQTIASNEVRWGVNQIESTGLNVDTSGSSTRSVVSYSTLFGGSVPFTHEAQAVVGDSGGAVFSWDGVSSWHLSGMMHAVNGYELQPSNTAVVGQSTFAADLSFYNGQIVSLTGIPEPSVSMAALLGSCALLVRRPRRQP
jgi:hypothetical protein